MQRKIIIASHHLMADGLKDTLDFITNDAADVVSLSAYMDDAPVNKAVDDLMASIPTETETVILTDMTAGSVNQAFFKYRQRANTHLISGMNLPLALAIAMEPTVQPLTAQRIGEIITEAQSQMVYVNTMTVEADDDDE